MKFLKFLVKLETFLPKSEKARLTKEIKELNLALKQYVHEADNLTYQIQFFQNKFDSYSQSLLAISRLRKQSINVEISYLINKIADKENELKKLQFHQKSHSKEELSNYIDTYYR